MPAKWEKPFVLKRWEYARDEKEYTEDLMKINYGYYDGTGHWTSGEKAILAKEKRPVTTINIAFKFINNMVGNEIQNRNQLFVYPNKGGTVQIANVLNYLYKYIGKESNLGWHFTQSNKNGFITGQGWMKNIIEITDENDVEILSVSKNPKLIYFDPDSIELNLKDAQDVHEVVYMHKRAVIAKYPGAEKNIEKFYGAKGLLDHGLYVDKNNELCTLIYSEYKDYEKVKYWAYKDKDGAIQIVEKNPKRSNQREINKAKTVVKGIWHFGDVELTGSVTNPFGCGMDKFSYTLIAPYFVNGVGISVLEQFKSLVDIVNKSYSQALDILNRQPKAGGMFEEGSVDNEQQFRDQSRAGEWRKVKNLDRIKKDDPVDYPMAHMGMVKDSIALAKEDVVGLTEVFSGEAPGRVESGLGIQILRKQSGLSFEEVGDNLRYSQIEVGRKLLNQIREFWSTEKVARIVEQNGSYTDINIKPDKINSKNMSPNGEIGETKSWSNTLKDGKYDFTIDVNTPSQTQRMYNQMQAMQLFQIMPDPRLAPLLIDLLDFPQKDEWKAALQQAMNPGGTGSPIVDDILSNMRGGNNGQ